MSGLKCTFWTLDFFLNLAPEGFWIKLDTHLITQATTVIAFHMCRRHRQTHQDFHHSAQSRWDIKEGTSQQDMIMNVLKALPCYAISVDISGTERSADQTSSHGHGWVPRWFQLLHADLVCDSRSSSAPQNLLVGGGKTANSSPVVWLQSQGLCLEHLLP